MCQSRRNFRTINCLRRKYIEPNHTELCMLLETLGVPSGSGAAMCATKKKINLYVGGLPRLHFAAVSCSRTRSRDPPQTKVYRCKPTFICYNPELVRTSGLYRVSWPRNIRRANGQNASIKLKIRPHWLGGPGRQEGVQYAAPQSGRWHRPATDHHTAGSPRQGSSIESR